MGDPFDDCETVVEVLGQLAGSASVCWKDEDGERVFDSERAQMFVGYANERIKKIHLTDMAKMYQPIPAVPIAEPVVEGGEPEVP